MKSARVASRRSHRKSRTGCANCKKRRIKCDEEKPSCTNCVRHSIRCDFLPGQSSSASPSPRDFLAPVEHHSPAVSPAGYPYVSHTPLVPGDTPSPFGAASFPAIHPDVPSPTPPLPSSQSGLNLADLELLHNWCTSTSCTISPVPILRTLYRVSVPEIGLSNDFVMHGILAISAIHLSHFKPSRREYFRAQANAHHDAGLRIASMLLRNINLQNGAALYLFTMLCCFYTLGKGPKPGEFLLYGTEGIAEWLVIFRGVRSIAELTSYVARDTVLAPIFATGARRVSKYQHTAFPDSEHIRNLRQYVVETTEDQPENQMLYMQAIDELSKTFYTAYDGEDIRKETEATFAWIYRLEDEYVTLLQERKPQALAIFAHFCVLLKELDSNWWMKGWMHHLIAGIYYSLDHEHRPCIRWPMEETGWIPD